MRARLEIAVFAAGLCLTGTAGSRLLKRIAFQASPESLLYPALQLVKTREPNLHAVARLEISRLTLSVPVVEGDDETSLSVAAGHVPKTSPLGAPGNAVIAAHRDAEFRALRSIAIGDRIRVRSDKTYIYVVRRIFIVRPDDLTPLRATSESTLTLITCYPFRYVGAAPERFIVQAKLVGT